jgi:hypothetical protein
MWDIISNLPYDSLMQTAVRGAFLGFAAGALPAAVLLKLGFWKRENRAYNLAVKLFCLYIPVVLAVLVMAWRLNALARGETLDLVESFRPQVSALAAEKAGAALEAFGSDAGQASLPRLLHALKERLDAAADPILEPLPAPVHAMAKPVWETATRLAAASLEKELLDRLGARLGLKDPDTFLTQSIVLSLQGGILTDVVRVQIDKRFDGINGNIRLAAILLLLPVALEAALYRFSRRGKRSAKTGKGAS